MGLRGARVKNIVRELNNEKVDIIRWDSNIKQFMANALSPAKLKSLEVDEANRRVRIMVSDDQLSLAIGKRGQNARLTSKLTGWHVDIDHERATVVRGQEENLQQAVQILANIPGISTEQANALVHHGFVNFELLQQAEASDLAEFPELLEHAPSIIESIRLETTRRSPVVGGEGA